MKSTMFTIGLLLASAGATAQAPSQAGVAAALRPHASQWERLLAAEDARARTPAQLEILLEGVRTESPELRRLAVRALGRLERADLIDRIAPLLSDAAVAVRATAADAVAQAAHRGDGAAARMHLLAALLSERDDGVRAMLLESLGRTRHAGADPARITLEPLVARLDSGSAVRLGAARGLFFLVRQQPARAAVDANARAALLRAATTITPGEPLLQRRIRTVAAAALVAAGNVDAQALSSIMADTSALVRREAVLGLNTLADTAAAARITRDALADRSAMVRLDALRVYGRRFAAADGCRAVLDATRDGDAHVVLQAIDLLGTACPSSAEIVARLDSLAAHLPADAGAWHAPAHALVALAAREPGRARVQLPRFTGHPNFFVRTYAAAAATRLRDQETLRALTRDAHPNVRTAAVDGLRAVARHAADSVYIAQLTHDDSQLLQSAAAALDSSTHHAAVPALFTALERMSARRRETERDARAALLDRIAQLGRASDAARLRPFLRDYDSQIANRAAEIIGSWSGTRPEPQPVEPPPLQLPTFAQAEALVQARVAIEMQSGDTIELRLFPFEAATNAYRFARLAREGRYDGLTWHRVAANFVVQGGSHNANEYAGDGPFTRDEVGVPNWRGTVGLSTRGRDTGDAQLYFNLIDNVRLDHDYTILAEVVRGMDVVDRLLEGAVIRRIVVR